jgi:hypothetical protein
MEELATEEDLRKVEEAVMKAQMQRWEELRQHQAEELDGDTEFGSNSQSVPSALSEIR